MAGQLFKFSTIQLNSVYIQSSPRRLLLHPAAHETQSRSFVYITFCNLQCIEINSIHIYLSLFLYFSITGFKFLLLYPFLLPRYLFLSIYLFTLYLFIFISLFSPSPPPLPWCEGEIRQFITSRRVLHQYIKVLTQGRRTSNISKALCFNCINGDLELCINT